jgi:hypothetical protein
MKRGARMLASLLLTACGGQTTSGGLPPTVTGTVGGKPVTPALDGVGLVGAENTGGETTESYASAVLTNLPNTCAILSAGGNPANATALTLTVVDANAPIAPGTYTIDGGFSHQGVQVEAQYVVQDATCTSTTTESAESGTITFSSVGGSILAGSFDVAFPSGDHLQGTFASPLCDAAPGQSQADPVCKSY